MRRRGVILAGGGAALIFGPALALLLAGCGGDPDGYDPDLRYPPRADRLVVRTPPTPPADRHANGRLDDWLADLDPLGGRTLDPAAVPPIDRSKLTAALDDLFGTPSAPVVKADGAAALGLVPDRLAAGSHLYKDKCVQCHGMAGDGRGPTSLWVYPPARDFRRGQFKFVSAAGGTGKPTRDDLAKLIRHGINGNSMPPFQLLSDEQIADLAAYTIHLSLRGQVEYAALAALLGEDGIDGDLAAFCRAELAKAVAAWASAEGRVVRPKAEPPTEPKDAGDDSAHDERVRRGHAVFTGVGACVGCHRDYGRADHYLYDLWGVAVRPADLTQGGYKGGKEPLDLFRRITCGIPPSGMPAASMLTEGQVWDVVAFLRALPVPRHLPPDVRAAVYPEVK